jgi:hypothetical protein
MQSEDVHSEINALRLQLQTKSKEFDHVIENDLELGDAKKIFLEIRMLKNRLEEINHLNESGSATQMV